MKTKQLYPKYSTPTAKPVVTATVPVWDGRGFFWIVFNGDIMIDWGDGVMDALSVSGGREEFVYHDYSPDIDLVTVKIWGDGDAVSELFFGDFSPSRLDISGCRSLRLLQWWAFQPVRIDLSHNPLLEELYLAGSQFTELDLSGNRNLKYLDCGSCQLDALDVSDNPLLETLSCGNNRLAALHIPNSPLLENLDCSNNRLADLDISGCPLVERLNCSGNRLTGLDISKNAALRYLNCYDNPLAAGLLARMKPAPPQSLPTRIHAEQDRFYAGYYCSVTAGYTGIYAQLKTLACLHT